MSLNIKDPETVRLAAEVARLTGESKTGAIRRALAERKSRLSSRTVLRNRHTEIVRFLEDEVWPDIPKSELGKKLSKARREKILGIGRNGV